MLFHIFLLDMTMALNYLTKNLNVANILVIGFFNLLGLLILDILRALER